MNKVTMNGSEIALKGSYPKAGDKISDFALRAGDMNVRCLKDYASKVLLILTVPSIDTPVCDMELQKFNKDAGALPEDIKIIGVSADLPFAQSRWAAEMGVKNITMLSDHFDMGFAESHGVHMKDLRLLARAVFVYDKSGNLVYDELVGEVTKEPDYGKAVEAAKKAL